MQTGGGESQKPAKMKRKAIASPVIRLTLSRRGKSVILRLFQRQHGSDLDVISKIYDVITN